MRHETIYRKECRFRVAPVRMWLIPHPMTSLAGLVRWSNQSSASTSKKSRERPTTASPHFNSSSAENALPTAATSTFFLPLRFARSADRKSVEQGKSETERVDLGGRRII